LGHLSRAAAAGLSDSWKAKAFERERWDSMAGRARSLDPSFRHRRTP